MDKASDPTKPSQKNPAYLWYPKDALTDEAFVLMSYEQQGVYRALLDYQWLITVTNVDQPMWFAA